MIIIFALSVLGYSLVARIFQHLSDQFGFSKQFSITALLTLLILHVVGLVFLHQRPFVLWLFIGIIWISLNISPYFLRIHLMKSLKKQLIPLLDQVILGLQVGLSFRRALLHAIDGQSSWYRHQFLEIYNAMIVVDGIKTAARAKFLDVLMTEFIEIDRSSTKVVDQVRAFRRQVKTEEDFRRRSGQILEQVRMQAIIVTSMYVGLLVFVSLNFGFYKNLNLILFTASLFVGGLYWIFSVGRKMKWKT